MSYETGRAMAGERYPTIDGLRGVAALGIVLLHLERPGFEMPRSTYTAVDLFFLISGFVIAAAYERRIPELGAAGFMRVRLARLYPTYLLGHLILPLYFVVFALIDGAWLAKPGDLVRAMGLGLVFLPSTLPSPEIWEHDALFPLNAPAWSLMWEMAVNLVFVLILPWLSQRMLMFIVLCSGAALATSQIPMNGLDLGWSQPTLGWGAPRVAFSFFLGVLIWRAKIPRPKIPPLVVLAAVPLLFFLPPVVAVFLGYPLVLIAATRSGEPGSKVMAAMGALSYPLYVVHFPLLHWTRRFFAEHPALEAFMIPSSLALSLACAALVLKLWDEPVRRALARRAPLERLTPSSASSRTSR